MIYAVDRIAGGMVLCEALDTGEKSEFLLDAMPAGIREGDIVNFKDGMFRIDAEHTKKRKAELSKRLRGLFLK